MRRREQVRIQNGGSSVSADDVDLVNTTFKGTLCRFQLQYHAAGNNARMDESFDLFAGDCRNDVVAM